MSAAIYPGSFDPLTNGHLDVIKRGAQIFDKLIVAISDNPGKQPLFTKSERMEVIKQVVKPLSRVIVDSFDGLLVDYVKSKKIRIVLRGVRTISDFEYEYQMALTNRSLSTDMETVFIMTQKEYSFVSSKLIKEASSLGGDVSQFVPKEIEKQLKKKFLRP